MEITQAKIEDIRRVAIEEFVDSEGALLILRERFYQPNYSHDSLRQLVKLGRLRAFIFRAGALTEREPDADTRGKDLFFLRSDLEALPLPKRGNPHREKKASGFTQA